MHASQLIQRNDADCVWILRHEALFPRIYAVTPSMMHGKPF